MEESDQRFGLVSENEEGFRSSSGRLGLSDKILQPSDGGIGFSEKRSQSLERARPIRRPGLEDCLDVGPVSRSVEHRLEHDQCITTENRDRRVLEWNLDDVRRYLVMELVYVEEQ